MTTDVEHEDEGRDPGEALTAELEAMGTPPLSAHMERALNEALYTVQERSLLPDGVYDADTALFIYTLVSWALKNPPAATLEAIRM